MKTKFSISLLALLFYGFIMEAQIEHHNCGTEEVTQSGSSVSQNCNRNFGSFLTNHRDDMIPQGVERTLKIKTNVIFVQNDNGEGNWSLSNEDHVEYWARLFDTLNFRLLNLVQESCNCATAPTHYSNIHLEFVPRYIEIKNNHYWNHRNDPAPSPYNSENKSYLLGIHNLAKQDPTYVEGFDWIITTDSLFWDLWVADNGNNPIWTYGYDCINGPVYTKPLDTACVVYSGNPRYDLDWPAMWHMPDGYLVFVNAVNHVSPYGQAYIEKSIRATAGLALHEYGHYFGLDHNDACTENIMNSTGPAKRTSYTGCQVRNMYETLMTKNLRKYVICEDKLDFDLTVDSDETWRTNKRVFGIS